LSDGHTLPGPGSLQGRLEVLLRQVRQGRARRHDLPLVDREGLDAAGDLEGQVVGRGLHDARVEGLPGSGTVRAQVQASSQGHDQDDRKDDAQGLHQEAVLQRGRDGSSWTLWELAMPGPFEEP